MQTKDNDALKEFSADAMALREFLDNAIALKESSADAMALREFLENAVAFNRPET